MRILLLGRIGQLGWELERCLSVLGAVVAVDYPQLDLRDPSSARQWVQQTSADVIVNATAYTAVDKAESEPELAMVINAHTLRALAEEAKRQRIALIHFSTDYVFDGKKGSPYTEGDTPNPLNMYGKSKLAGEQYIQEVGGSYLILRTSWVYSLRRDSFVTKVLEWARSNQTLKIVDDQIANPTWARALAEATATVLARVQGQPYAWIKERRGIYHLAGSGACSRYEWALKILENDPKPDQRMAKEVSPAKTADFPTPAQRPLFSALNCDLFISTFGIQLPPWQEALRLAMQEFSG